MAQHWVLAPLRVPVHRLICPYSVATARTLTSDAFAIRPLPRTCQLPRSRPFHHHGRLRQQSAAHSPSNSDTAAEVEAAAAAPARPRRSLRTYIYIAGFLLLGMGMGQFVRAVVVPPPLPVPDTPEDEMLRAKIRKDMDRLPIVQELRAHRDAWLEYEAYMTKPEAERASSLTAGTMGGARGLAVQRIFWNKAEQRLLAVIFLGGGITGWPGVTHGGAVATVLLENLERAALGPEVYPEADQAKHWVNLFDITYKKPTQANKIYLLRAEVEEAADGLEALASDHIRVTATLEDALTGSVTASATGRCTTDPIKWSQEEAASLWSRAGRLLGWR